jgi:hypothetical protein
MIVRGAATVLGLLVWLGPVAAEVDANVIEGSVDLGSHLGKELITERNGKSYTLTDKIVGVEFVDPRKRGEIRPIIFDPVFSPPQSDYADFWLTTTVQLAQDKSLTETALCYWNKTKTVATCSIECGGGQYEIIADRAKTNLENLNLILRVRSLGDYHGFSLGDWGCSGEDTSYQLTIGNGSVDLPIQVEH